MSTKQEWRERSHQLGGRHGLECGMLVPSGSAAHVVVNIGGSQVNLGDHAFHKHFMCTSDFMYASSPTWTICNHYVDVGGLLPAGFVTETLVPNITGKNIEDMSLFPLTYMAANTPPDNRGRASIYVRVSSPGENAASTAELKKSFKLQWPTYVGDDENFDGWLQDELRMDPVDLDLETLMESLEEQYGLVVPLKEIMGKIAYTLCKVSGKALENCWAYVEGTQYENEYIKILTGGDILDSQIKGFTSKILGD